MAQYLDTNTNPLNDGSLTDSFTFNNTPTSLVRSSTLSGTQNPLVYTTGGKFNETVLVANNEFYATSLGHGFAGEQDLTIVFWVYAQPRTDGSAEKVWGALAFGEFGQRYNIEFTFSHDSANCYLDVTGHKGASTIIRRGLIENQWNMITLKYRSSDQRQILHVNDGAGYTSNVLQMKFLDKPYQISTQQATGADDFLIDQIMTFTGNITDTERLSLYNEMVGSFQQTTTVNISDAIPHLIVIASDAPAFVGEYPVVEVPVTTSDLNIVAETVDHAGIYQGAFVYPTTVELMTIIASDTPTVAIQKVYDLSKFYLLQEVDFSLVYSKFNLIQEIEQSNNGGSLIIVRSRH